MLDLADSKTGPRRVYLSEQAQDIIERQPRAGSDYVFPSPRVAIVAERPDHGLGVPVNDGEQHPSCPVGNTASPFPLLKSPHVETEAVGELLTAQPKSLAQRNNPAGGGIVDDPA